MSEEREGSPADFASMLGGAEREQHEQTTTSTPEVPTTSERPDGVAHEHDHTGLFLASLHPTTPTPDPEPAPEPVDAAKAHAELLSNVFQAQAYRKAARSGLYGDDAA